MIRNFVWVSVQNGWLVGWIVGVMGVNIVVRILILEEQII